MPERGLDISLRELTANDKESKDAKQPSASEEFKSEFEVLEKECDLSDRDKIKDIRDYHKAKFYVHGAMAKDILPYYFSEHPEKKEEWRNLSYYADGDIKIMNRLADELRKLRPIEAINMAIRLSENDRQLSKDLIKIKARIVDAFADGTDASHDKLHGLMVKMTDWYWDDSRLPEGMSYMEGTEFRKKDPEYIKVDNLRHHIADILTGMPIIG